ncbi:biotin/lipoyl-containing protein, partial [Leucobacter sp.]
MASIVRMPELVTGSAEAAIAAWLVAVGDEVSAGQPIVEIETEKATVEYEAEGSGVLAGTLLEAGTSVEVGTPIAVLATGGQSAEEALAEAGATAGGVSGGVSGASDSGSAQPDPEPVPDPEPAPSSESGAAPADPGAPAAPGERRFASPLVRKLVRERGLDLSGVRGTGPNGRIVRRDLEGLAAAPAADSAIP